MILGMILMLEAGSLDCRKAGLRLRLLLPGRRLHPQDSAPV